MEANTEQVDVLRAYDGINDSNSKKDSIRAIQSHHCQQRDVEYLSVFDDTACNEENAVVWQIKPDLTAGNQNQISAEEEKKHEDEQIKDFEINNRKHSEIDFTTQQQADPDDEFMRSLAKLTMKSSTTSINDSEKVLYVKVSYS